MNKMTTSGFLKLARTHHSDSLKLVKQAIETVESQKSPQAKVLLIDLQSFKLLHLELTSELVALRERVQASGGDSGELVDCSLVLRQVAQLADDLRKEAEGTQRLLDKVCCAVWVREHQNDTRAKPDGIAGTLGKGHPQVKMVSVLPKKRTDEYRALMKHIGVPEKLVESGLVSVHWPSMQDMLMERAASGAPMPPGINPDKTYPDFRMDVRSRTDLSGNVDELALA